MIICGTMKLKPGHDVEYKKRHDELWPDMKALLRRHGLHDYYIFLDNNSHTLFSFVNVENKTLWDEVSHDPICQQWWMFMKDIMETNPDNSPVFNELQLVFELHK